MGWFAYLRWLFWTLLGKEAKRLNLVVHRLEIESNWWGEIEYIVFWGDSYMAKIGDRFTATIAPTNAAGNPAPVTDSVFDELSAAYDLESVAADGLSAVFIAVAAGTGAVVTVTAKTKSGLTLADSKPLPDVDVPVDEEAVALNLSVA